MAANFERPAPFDSVEAEVAWGRRWQHQLCDAGWVGLDWPVAHGGRAVTPTLVALFNFEYARVLVGHH